MSHCPPLRLPRSQAAWGTPEFEATLKAELEEVAAECLPLQQGLSYSSYVGDSPFRVVPISTEAEAGVVRATVGIIYTGIIAGCSCADDPTPQDEQTEYCRLRVEIDASGNAQASLLADEP